MVQVKAMTTNVTNYIGQSCGKESEKSVLKRGPICLQYLSEEERVITE